MKSSTHKTFQTLYATLSLGVFSVLLTPVLTTPAQADIYHSVEPGESLASVAKRYNTNPAALREANQLGNISESSVLSAMLLRVPGEDAEKSASRAVKAPADKAAVKSSTPAAGTGRYSGSVTKNIFYKVQPGDTVESLAASFTQSGQTVTAQDIRQKNKISGQPAAGSTLLIPAKTTYGASAQMNPPVATARAVETSSDRGNIGVSVSEEVALPFARAVQTSGTPSYQAPNSSPARKTPVVSRGNLSSRSASQNIDGARILQNGEELLTTPSPRVRTTPTATNANMAKVAKIATAGARIRRLPDATAVTLYKCSTGTEIAVIAQRSGWSAILMSDRSTGWIPSRYLKLTGASVDIASQVETYERRGDDTASGWRSGYSSNHPAIKHALSYLGTRYVYGGTSRRGIDCSSLMQHSFGSAGVRLPRTAAQQARVGKPVAPENLQPGDRLYFSASGTRIDHTGLYMGNGLFVHASGSARKVTVSRLADRRTWNIFVSARR